MSIRCSTATTTDSKMHSRSACVLGLDMEMLQSSVAAASRAVSQHYPLASTARILVATHKTDDVTLLCCLWLCQNIKASPTLFTFIGGLGVVKCFSFNLLKNKSFLHYYSVLLLLLLGTKTHATWNDNRDVDDLPVWVLILVLVSVLLSLLLTAGRFWHYEYMGTSIPTLSSPPSQLPLIIAGVCARLVHGEWWTPEKTDDDHSLLQQRCVAVLRWPVHFLESWPRSHSELRQKNHATIQPVILTVCRIYWSVSMRFTVANRENNIEHILP